MILIVLKRPPSCFKLKNTNLCKSIEVLNRFSAHQFYTPLFTQPTFEGKNGNDENKTLFAYFVFTSSTFRSNEIITLSSFGYLNVLIIENHYLFYIVSTRKRPKFFSSDLLNFTIYYRYQDRNEDDTRVFYHLERSTEYLARCARRDTIKIVTYYEASEKDVNYACVI